MEEKQIIFLTDGAGTHEYSHTKKKKKKRIVSPITDHIQILIQNGSKT